MYQFRVNRHEQHAGWVTTDGSSFNDALQAWHARHLDASDIVYDHFVRNETPPSNEVEYRILSQQILPFVTEHRGLHPCKTTRKIFCVTP
jgi:hypothetical protein